MAQIFLKDEKLYLMIISNNNLREMILNQIQYLGLPFISVLWMMVALLYTKTIYSLKTRMTVLLFAVPVITFLMRLTNSWHHLFYTKWEIRQFLGYYSLYMERGFWYYVNISYTILCLLLTVVIYLVGYLKTRPVIPSPIFWSFCLLLAAVYGYCAHSFTLAHGILIIPL